MKINVLEYLEKTAQEAPDKIALIDEFGSITFGQLMERAKAMGSHIHRISGGETRRPVIVFVDRNLASIVSFFGILYSGNYYVPIDVQTPPARLEAMEASLLPLAGIDTADSASGAGAKDTSMDGTDSGMRILYAEAISAEVDEEALQQIRNNSIDTDPAYVMFTSGSTGVPKGVVVNHKGIIDLAEWLSETFAFSNEQIIGNQTPFYFDASVKDIYMCIRNAATMHIIPKKLFAMPVRLMQYLNESKINTILWATSAIRLMANLGVFKEIRPEFLKKIFFAGENMPAKQYNIWKAAMPDAEFFNLYGPTEITVDCAWYKVEREFADDESIPIGSACRNMEILLLDEKGNPVEPGDTGEIYVRGTGVALGYYNNAEQTAASFVQNPLQSNYPETVYRTGDLARYNEYGELIFASRKDTQVKHMGNRIELEEIETAVNALPGIGAAVCLYDRSKETIVLIYQGEGINKVDIVKGIRNRIPRYMTPGIFYEVEAMPETANGKINRRKLEEDYLT